MPSSLPVTIRVPYQDGRREVWIYLLVEHQSKPDRLMGLRLLSYVAGSRRAAGDTEGGAGAIGLLEQLPVEAQAEWRRAMLFFVQLILHKRNWTGSLSAF